MVTPMQGSGNLRTAVRLPEGEDLQEWIAVHGTYPPTSKRPTRLTCIRSGRLLQPYQHALWDDFRVLHTQRSGFPYKPSA